MYFLGLDIGSSSSKVSVLDAKTGKSIASTHYPKTELAINAPQAGFAEQDPNSWWSAVKAACAELFDNAEFDPKQIEAIGISYQMHGLVCVDKQQEVIRPAIIWCDSRAVEIGDKAFKSIGEKTCLSQLLNSPGNFTASKLKWVKENQPDLYQQIDKIMLPGDFIAMKLTGEITTTPSGLSEGVLWNFAENTIAHSVLEEYGFESNLIPNIVPSFADQGTVSQSAAQELGLRAGIKVTYRGGDQPNNAMSLNVMEPGEVAATAGTSGVVYAVTDKNAYDPKSRVNTFQHVSSTEQEKRNGVLLCVNGTGRLYSWVRSLLNTQNSAPSYPALNAMAEKVNIGSDGLVLHPFGNGAERVLQNKNMGGHMRNIDFNRHQLGHIVRGAQEGIVFALKYGFDVLTEMGVSSQVVRAGKGNMFLSPIFVEAFVNSCQTSVELYDTDGAEGAARAAGLGLGYFTNRDEMFNGLTLVERFEPQADKSEQYAKAYQDWKQYLEL
ncbi:xylulokinase [Catenovulum adriaticum]|uniref:FGGY family carbohydrate kinase n=1 Tax=Catenovulum adriaticum TaxID=2984846 RepID=A0ABY7AHQ7_9ALTE|nr:FGGY family carbohydrate kinase [Catenovulum sp. TS8]WAJ69140.1 FGGY family carbohydrate kinase [Catenovulum sp. TS8]